MGILVNSVRISGFRGINECEIQLSKMTVLVGMNNSGKTSVIKALQLALGDYARQLTIEDFHIDSEQNRCKELVVDVQLIPFSEEKALKIFPEEWTEEFSDIIQMDSIGSQFVGIRTICKEDPLKGGFAVERFYLKEWPAVQNWKDYKVNKKDTIKKRIDAIPFFSIDAQRDIHQELKEKASYIGKVLSTVEYENEDVKQLETLIRGLNEAAVDKSSSLKGLCKHLESLNRSFEGAGVAEVTPFPKRLRDLSCRYNVNFGADHETSFAMEYHGMGTRSWASMLSVKAFSAMLEEKYKEDVKPFFPFIAAEEPEAHLHPNAQRTLYSQLCSTKGQTVVSTHSPYVAAMASLADLRGLAKTKTGIEINFVPINFKAEDRKILRREILRTRGEILFSKALILFEGVTEEQVIPVMFKKYFGVSAYEVGVSCLAVNGKRYHPFFKLGKMLKIPIVVISDNEASVNSELTSQLKKIADTYGWKFSNDELVIHYLSKGNDFEAELLLKQQLLPEIREILLLIATEENDNVHYLSAKRKELEGKNADTLLKEIRKCKACYSGLLAEVLEENPNGRDVNDLIPSSVRAAFDNIKSWL